MSAAGSIAADGPPARPAHSVVRWRILAILFAGSFVGYILRQNMSISGVGMMEDLGLSTVQLGVILGAFSWAYGIFQFPGGVFGDRMGARKALTIITVAWGLITIAIGLAPGSATLGATGVIAMLALLRFAMGMAQAPLFPINCGGCLRVWFPVTGWGLPNGLITMGLSFGAAATGPLVAWLMQSFGWRMSFIATAPLAFLSAGLWWWYGRDRPADHPAVSPAELALIEADRPPPEEEGGGDGWKRVLMNRQILLLTISYFCMNYVFYIYFNWFFVYLVEQRGFTALEGGWMAAAPWLVGAFSAPVGGWLGDVFTRRFGVRWGTLLVIVPSLVIVAFLLLAGAMAPDPYVAVALLALCFGFVQMTDAPFWSATMYVGGEHGAAATGVLNTGGNIVGGIGALLVPVTAEAFGWIPAIGTGSLFALVGAGLWLWIRVDQRMHEPA